MNITEQSPSVVIHYRRLVSPPKPIPGSVQRWNTPGYRHSQRTYSQGETRTFLSREPSWEWIETTNWQPPAIRKDTK